VPRSSRSTAPKPKRFVRLFVCLITRTRTCERVTACKPLDRIWITLDFAQDWSLFTLHSCSGRDAAHPTMSTHIHLRHLATKHWLAQANPRPAIVRDRMRNARKQTNKQTKTHRFGPVRSRPRACLPTHRAVHPSLHPHAHMDPRADARTHAHAHTSPSPDGKPGDGPSIVQGDGAEWQSRAAGTVLRCDRDSVQARMRHARSPQTGNGLLRSPQPGMSSCARPNRE
jgi:hypothetical protein